MDMNTSTFNFRIPWAVIVALLVVAIIELTAISLPVSFWRKLLLVSSVKGDQSLRFDAKLKAVDKTKLKIILIGSSQIREGVSAQLLE